jgi:hypothetical protein
MMTSTISPHAAPSGVLGVQEPRIWSSPPAVASAGREAVELARMAGLELDPWQELVLASSLGEREDGKWASFEVGVVCPRQNGKNSILEARELAGLFLLDERFLVHSAHQFDTSLEAFRRLLFLIEDTPEFERRVHRVVKSHGEEGIELKKNPRTGLRQRIRFRTRTKGGGRGFTGDWLGLDEAMILPETAHGALLPTLSARPNPQVWYTGSAVDQEVHEHGIVLARIRERGMRGDDPSLTYAEWSADEHSADPTDTEAWTQANPGLGIRISLEHVAREQRSMDARTFATERLGIGDWPATDGSAGRVIDLDAWRELVDPASSAKDPVCLSFDVTPDRSAACISAAGWRPDRLTHLEVVEHGRGTAWVPKRLAELKAAHRPVAVICDGSGPAASLLAELENLKVAVTLVNAKEHAQACGLLYDAVEQRSARHLGTLELEGAVAGAVKRPLGDAWAWSRKSSAVDISPLVSITLALWGLQTMSKPRARVVSLSEALANADN